MEKGLITKRFKLLAPLLDSRQLRLYVAAEALVLGRGGIFLTSQATGVSRPTITIGCKELLEPDVTETIQERLRHGPGAKTWRRAENAESIWMKRFEVIWRA